MISPLSTLITLIMENLIRYIDPELDALMARVQLISYRYILL